SGHALLEDRPVVPLPPVERRAQAQLVPDPLLRPVADVLVVRRLHEVARELGRPEREEREAALVVRIHELVHRRRDPREDAEPAERILALERSRRHRAATYAVESVAAGDHVTLELTAGVPDRAPLRIDGLD